MVYGPRPFMSLIAGSSPAADTNATVAQQVERRPEEPSVVGSIPTGGTIKYAGTV